MKKTETFWLNYFRPSLFIKNYTKLNIFSLKKNGIKMLICDLDNTLAPHFSRFPTRDAINFVSEVQKQGIIFIIASNNSKKRVSTYCEKLKPNAFIYNAKKPFMRNIQKIIEKNDLSPEEVIIMGDQFITDIWLANRLSCKSILVLPMLDPNKDASTSALQKMLDKFIYRKLQHNNYLQYEENSESGLENDYDII